MKYYLTIKEAAAALGVSHRHIVRLIDEADATPKIARWKFGKELIELTPATSRHRTIRINPNAIGFVLPSQQSQQDQ